MESTNKRYAIIVAGGSGIRMGTDKPKQFIEVNGLPILMYTLLRFDSLTAKPEIILVLPEQHVKFWKELCQNHSFQVPHTIAYGGSTRFQSVKNGLNLVESRNSLVAIHDGVRPLVSVKVIESCYAMAAEKGSAIPVISPVESIRISKEGKTESFPREKVMLVQTPQTFKTGIIKDCYQIPYSPDFTDDASVVEANGIEIFTVEGNRENIKITTPSDLIMAKTLLKKFEYK